MRATTPGLSGMGEGRWQLAMGQQHSQFLTA